MSFIIGKKQLRTILFFADTKVSIDIIDDTISGGNKMRVNPMQGILKTYILNSKLCISFAGKVENCLNIIQKCKEIELPNIPFFLQNELLISNDDNSEFIVGISEISKTFMYKINSSTIEQGETFWTGEKEGFKEYQTYFHNPENYCENKFTQAGNAFNELIQNTKVMSIGDFIVETVYEVDLNSFIYCERMQGFRGERVIQIKQQETTALDIQGSNEIGSFHVSNLVSRNPNKPAVAIYFQLANSGILFTPEYCLKNNGCGEIFTGSDINQFVKEIYDKYEIKIEGFTLINSRIVKI
ncbi:hypothetical protein [Flavobacterium suzhouense]|uniref:Uncharacterized protein n=1 Tax=Flavobacterium suzhouense TaxID=1529638 RepID=A0ABW5NR22_9FLAO